MAQDCSLRSIIAYLFVVVASVLALTYADRHAGAKEAAGYSYVAPQVAPPVASRLSMAQLDAILNETAPNTPYLVAYQLKTTDAHGAVASAARKSFRPMILHARISGSFTTRSIL